MTPQPGRPSFRSNPAAAALTLWWLFFGAVGIYWAAGGTWGVDTAVQDQGRQLARERPTWFIAVVIGSGVVKLLFALFGYLIAVPIGRRIPRFLYLLGGYSVGIGCLLYGLARTMQGIPPLLAGETSDYLRAQLLLWMPQFWVGGLLMVIATAVYQRQTRRRASKPVPTENTVSVPSSR